MEWPTVTCGIQRDEGGVKSKGQVLEPGIEADVRAAEASMGSEVDGVECAGGS